MNAGSALITGATSHLGRRLGPELLRRGWDVHALVRPSTDRECLGKIRSHEWDGGAESMRAAVEASRPTHVFHLAVATASPAAELVEANVLLGALLLEALPAPARFVNAATCWQHAADGRVEPRTLHAATKEAFASILEWHERAGRVDVVTLVLHDVYGPRDTRDKLLPALLRALKTGEPAKLTAGEQRVDCVHVDDAVAALLRAASGDGLAGTRWAVRTGALRSVREIVATLERVAGRPVPVEWGARPTPPQALQPPWEGPILPGWSARIDLETGLRDVLGSSA